MKPERYIASNIDKLSHSQKVHIARILYFRNVELKQSNNGVYCFIKVIDEKTKKEVESIIKLFLKT